MILSATLVRTYPVAGGGAAVKDVWLVGEDAGGGCVVRFKGGIDGGEMGAEGGSGICDEG